MIAVGGFLSWWDGVELWLSGLGFVLQTIVVMPVVLALAYLIALVLDAALGQGIRVIRGIRARSGPDGPLPHTAARRASSLRGDEGSP